MTYEALLKSDIPLITLDFIDNAINKYNYIRNKNNLLDEQDSVDLSFLFTCLTNDLFYSTREILKKYNLDINTVANYYKMEFMSLEIASEDNKSYIYDRIYQEVIDGIIEYKFVKIYNLYPEDILIDVLEAPLFKDYLFKLGINDENKKLLENDLINNKNKRNRKKLNMDYNDIQESVLPMDTKWYIGSALEHYNIFFNLNNYHKALFIKEEYKIIFVLMYTIISHLYHKDFLKNYYLNTYDILTNFEMIYDKELEYLEFDKLEKEKLYNGKFKDFINDVLNKSDIFKGLGYDLECFYPESLYIAIGFDNEFANNFYKILGLTELDIINLKKDMHVSLKERILSRDINKKYEHNKYFNISDYANSNTKRLENKIYDDEVLNSEYKSNSIYKENDYIRKYKDYKVLKKYGYFLDEKEYISNPAIGRELEIKKVILSLLTQNKSSILVGPAGVGKTAIVEGLAYLLKSGNVPELLKDKKIISISTTSLISGCQYVGMVEERMGKILKELESNKEVIMFIDEIHTIVGAGKGINGNNDISNILKPYLDRGTIKIIGSTTEEEYENIMTDPALRRRFEKTTVKELDENTLKKVLYNEIDRLETRYNIKFDFNDKNKEKIIDILINLTKEKNQTYYDKENNPSLVLNILDKSFVLALYENRSSVEINDIKESINMCDKIYDSVKEREVLKLDNIVNETKERKYTKVIKFPISN